MLGGIGTRGWLRVNVDYKEKGERQTRIIMNRKQIQELKYFSTSDSPLDQMIAKDMLNKINQTNDRQLKRDMLFLAAYMVFMMLCVFLGMYT